MTTYNTAYNLLSLEQYLAIVTAGSTMGPAIIADASNYNAVVAESQKVNVDPRIPLTVCWQEGHFGTDPNLVAAKVFNLGGIKWVGQPGAYDSGIPADTGGTYAGFPDTHQYWHELLRTLTNDLIGPYLRAGDLQGAFRKYTNWTDPHSADGKMAIYEMVLKLASPSGAAVPGVYGEDIIKEAQKYIGTTNWNGEDGNPPHPSAYWCEAFAEFVPRSIGLDQIRRADALAKGNALKEQGLLYQGAEPEHGAWVIFDGRFFFQGHIGFWDADRKQLLGTLTNPAPNGTIDYIDWGPQTYGYMGWARIPGVVDARRMVVHPGEQTSFVLGGNPYGPISMSGKFWARWDALNTMGTPLSAPGIINPLGLALPQIGFPREEATTIAGRRMQKFERCWLAEQDAPEPYDVVSLLLTELPA